MKTTIEINGYQILISEEEGKVMVSATKDDEVVEEFTLETEGSEEMGEVEEFGAEGEEEMMPFGGEEEEDFGDEDSEEDEDDEDEFDSEDEDENEDDEEEGKLESFRSFVKNRK